MNCSAPTTVVSSCDQPGVERDGSDAIFVLDMYVCARGHRYHVVNEEKSVRLVT